MSTKKRCLMLGAGGMARTWIHDFLAKFPDRIDVAGLVDVNEQVLTASGDFLNLPVNRRFTDMAAAFAAVDADFCIIVIPPAFHHQAVMHAVERRMPILSEKPIADTWESCLDIYAAIKNAGLKMEVVQNYRYTTPMLTMRQVLREGDLGRINYLTSRFAADYRAYGSWGVPFRHEIPHALLVEGAIHHFDMLRNLSGADCLSIAGWEWNPPWSSSKGDFCNLYVLRMTNDIHAVYEGSGTGSGEQNTWHEEYYRAECEHGAVTVGRDHIVRIHRFTPSNRLAVQEIPPVTATYQGHTWVINEFLDWLDGGPQPDTIVDDNMKSVAMIFAAMESSRSSEVVPIERLLSMIPFPSTDQ